MRHEFLVLELVETEAEALFPLVVIMLDIRNDPSVNLYLHVVCLRVLPFVLVHGFKILPHDITFGYDVCSESVGQGTDDDA